MCFLFFFTGLIYAQTAQEYYNKGLEYGIAGKFGEAKIEFEKALKLEPYYEDAGLCAEIIELTGTGKIKKETVVHVFKALKYEEDSKFDEAVISYREALKFDQYPFIYNNLGKVYGDKGILDKAKIEFEKAVEIDPGFARGYNNLGIIYAREGDLDTAIGYFKKSLEISPSALPPLFNLARAYAKKDNFDAAEQVYKKIIEIDPEDAEAHYYLGVVYINKEMADEAISELKKAIELYPDYAAANNDIAVVYYFKEDYELAIKYCDRAIELGYEPNEKFLEALKPYRKQKE
ncbi:MAG: tetratricopeptide repeat protein [Armatimonadota bacterium]